jgi:hypothetical protein
VCLVVSHPPVCAAFSVCSLNHSGAYV